MDLREERPLCDKNSEGALWYNYTDNILYKCEQNVWTILNKREYQSPDFNECKINNTISTIY